jgi:hypothetical protein
MFCRVIDLRHVFRKHLVLFWELYDRQNQEIEQWEIADVVTLPAQGHLLKAGIWWILFYRPMAVVLRHNRYPGADWPPFARDADQSLPWPPL